MGEYSAIEWTDATFNPWWGCRRISPACDNCYADTWALRLGLKLWDNGQYRTFGAKHWAEPLKWNRKAEKEGRRLRVFCASMGDVFDKDAPTDARADLWDLIEDTPHLDWLLLTKRIGNASRMLPAHWGEGYPNVWLGSSVVTQEEVDRDVPKLIEVPALLKFLSIEPILEPIELFDLNTTGGALRGPAVVRSGGMTVGTSNDPPEGYDDSYPGIDWVIVGGESGARARPISPLWVDSLRKQCSAVDVAFFFKQWGEWAPSSELGLHGHERAPTHVIPPHVLMRVGKKIAGRSLDGITYSEWPDSPAATSSEER